MRNIVMGEKSEGCYWLDQIDVPLSVQNLMVLDRHNRTPEQQTRTIKLGGEIVQYLAIPADDLGYPSEAAVHDAILSAMGYTEEDLPQFEAVS